MMPKITSSVKTSIANEWLQLFPELGKFKPNLLYIRNGPILHGINIQWLMGNQLYKPHYELLIIQDDVTGKNLSTCFVDSFKYNERYLELDISENSLPAALEEFRFSIQQQCFIPFHIYTAPIEILNLLHSTLKAGRRENRRGIFQTIRFLAGYIRDTDRQASLNYYTFAIEGLTEITQDKFVRNSYEVSHKMPIAAIFENYEHEYNTLNYALDVERVIEKYKLNKLPKAV
ncbi:MAG: hypothetical protein EOP51_09285 [Sphingobacteriales bacterium]|nr:MAG: hypothetical protein EOP51_09285 [Sphingobacteriales bacterium]